MNVHSRSIAEGARELDENHFDVLIVGAGISGIAAAVELRRQSPWAKFTVLEAMESFGGTWFSNTYPGARSDSDMFTYGYSFKPWLDAPIARKELIQEYLGEVVADYDLDSAIKYNHRILSANWSDAFNKWEIQAQIGDSETVSFATNFLMMCQGYYRHREGYMPQWDNVEKFEGRLLHAQRWPDDLDVSGKRVVVIGSGATAATLIPALAEKSQHIVQLQRSPSYYIPFPNEHPLASQLRKLDIPDEWTHEIIRRQILSERKIEHCLEDPDGAREEFLNGVKQALGGTLPDDFVPRYQPWHQRACLIPDNDFFECIKSGKASVRTGEIAEFTANGMRLKSCEEIAADIVIAATGFNVNAFGDIAIMKNGEPHDMTRTVTYRGFMFTDTPNFSWTIGYFRSAPYTFRSELIAGIISRLVNHMHENRLAYVCPRIDSAEKDFQVGPFWHEDDFRPGYVVRAVDCLPKSGPAEPWRHSQDYQADRVTFASLDYDQEPLHFERSRTNEKAFPDGR